MAANTNSTNPFKAAEERKRREAEERKKREAEERAKQAAEEAAVKGAEVAEPVAAEAPVVTEAPAVPAQEPAPAPAAAPVIDPLENAVNKLREQEDKNNGKKEKKIPVNIMLPPSLKRKAEQDIRNKKVKSLSDLITSLLEAYYE